MKTVVSVNHFFSHTRVIVLMKSYLFWGTKESIYMQVAKIFIKIICRVFEKWIISVVRALSRINRRTDQSFRFDAGVKLAYVGLGRWLPSLKQDWFCHVCVPLSNLCPQPSWHVARLFDTEEDSCMWFEGPATKHFTFLWKRMKTCWISKTSERQAKQLK